MIFVAFTTMINKAWSTVYIFPHVHKHHSSLTHPEKNIYSFSIRQVPLVHLPMSCCVGRGGQAVLWLNPDGCKSDLSRKAHKWVCNRGVNNNGWKYLSAGKCGEHICCDVNYNSVIHSRLVVCANLQQILTLQTKYSRLQTEIGFTFRVCHIKFIFKLQ